MKVTYRKSDPNLVRFDSLKTGDAFFFTRRTGKLVLAIYVGGNIFYPSLDGIPGYDTRDYVDDSTLVRKVNIEIIVDGNLNEVGCV